MKLTLTNTSLSNSWLYGIIENDGIFLCDTLEFGSMGSLPSGNYTLKLTQFQSNLKPLISIYNDVNEYVSCINTEPCIFWRNRKIREKTTNITIGLKTSEPLLVMHEYVFTLCLTALKRALSRNENIELVIMNSQYRKDALQIRIETITNY